MNSSFRMTRMCCQRKAIVILTFIQVFSGLYGKDNCPAPRHVLRSFDVPESCAKLNFTSECNSVAVIRACQDDHTKSCHITKSILCDRGSRHETTTYCTPGETLIINNTFLVCKTSGEPARVSYPECGVRECGDFGEVSNGTYVMEIVRVAKHEYASRVKVQCNEGFVLNGWSVIDCTDKRTWSTSMPECIPVKCGRLPGQTSPCLQEIKLDTSHDVIRADFTCLDGNDISTSVTLVDRLPNISTTTSYCDDTSGTWSWTHGIGCYCNCFVPADFSKMVASDLVNGIFLKHGKELKWDCVDGYRKTQNRTFKCEDKRLISIEYQSAESDDLVCSDTQAEFLQCVTVDTFTEYGNCFVPADYSKVNASDLVNGTFLKHGQVLKWDCVDGYRKTCNRTFKCEDKRLISIEYQSTESDDLVCSDKQAEFLQCVKLESVTFTEPVEEIKTSLYVVIAILAILVGLSLVFGIATFIRNMKNPKQKNANEECKPLSKQK